MTTSNKTVTEAQAFDRASAIKIVDCISFEFGQKNVQILTWIWKTCN